MQFAQRQLALGLALLALALPVTAAAGEAAPQAAAAGSSGTWHTPEKFMEAVNNGYSFRRTSWNAMKMQGEHPQ